MPLKLDALDAGRRGQRPRGRGRRRQSARSARRASLLAGNTDVGAVDALIGRTLAQRRARRWAAITLLGTGGAARAALVALHLLEIDRRSGSRRATWPRRSKLAVAVRARAPSRARFDAPIDSRRADQRYAARDARPPPPHAATLALMPDNGWVFDLVTDPPKPPLLERARARGCARSTAIEMLVEQAAESFKLLFGAGGAARQRCRTDGEAAAHDHGSR